MKGIYNLRPPKPKLSFVWDVSIIFRYFENLGENDILSDRDLSHKLVMLLLLLNGQRMNTIMSFDINQMILNKISVTFSPVYPLKHSKKGRKLETFTYRAYDKTNLCIISCLREYLARRKDKVHQDCTQLIITYGKPYKEASIDTVRRWVKDIFKINEIFDFTPHSCRSASTSKAKAINVDITEILKRGCWKNEKTFRSFYDKEIVQPINVEFEKILE